MTEKRTPYVKEAYPEDFEKVYPLLKKLNDTRLKKNDWQKLFKNNFGSEENHNGYILYNNDEPVGFFGLIFSRRVINDRVYKFANMTSWIVLEEYRKYGLLLFLRVKKLKEYTLTNFTPTAAVVGISKELGFKTLDDTFVFIPYVPLLNLFNSSSVKIINNTDDILTIVNDEEKRYVTDHKNLNAYFSLIKKDNDYCLVIYSKVKKKGISLGYAHYISNAGMFSKYARNLLPKNGIMGFLVYSRYIKGHLPGIHKKLAIPNPRQYMSSELQPEQIDSLYSEIAVI